MASKERGRHRVRLKRRGLPNLSKTFPAGTPKTVVDDWERKLKLGLIDRSLVEGCPTLEEYAPRFLKLFPSVKPTGRQESTIVKDRSSLDNHLIPAFGKWRLSAIKPKHVLEFQATLIEHGYGGQTIRNILSTLSNLYKLAIIEEVVEGNPASVVPRPARKAEPAEFWSFDEKDRALVWAREHDFDLFQVMAFACEVGPRPGELEALLGDCLNLREGYVDLRRTFCTKTRQIKNRIKNGVSRRIYLSEEVRQVLANKAGLRSDERVFPLNWNLVSLRRLTPLCEGAGVKRITPHGWRHTCASHLLMLGRTPKDVQTILGHKKVATTLDTYGHLLEDYKRGITSGMNEGMRWLAAGAAATVIPANFRSGAAFAEKPLWKP
jgi:integrase